MNQLGNILGEFGIETSNILLSGARRLGIIVGILIAMKIALSILNRLIDRFFENKKIGKFSMEERRANTLSNILKSILRYTIYFLGFMTIAGLFVDVTSILAVAGVGSLAIGFGAQSLVKDIVTGFFIFFENQFS